MPKMPIEKPNHDELRRMVKHPQQPPLNLRMPWTIHRYILWNRNRSRTIEAHVPQNEKEPITWWEVWGLAEP